MNCPRRFIAEPPVFRSILDRSSSTAVSSSETTVPVEDQPPLRFLSDTSQYMSIYDTSSTNTVAAPMAAEQPPLKFLPDNYSYIGINNPSSHKISYPQVYNNTGSMRSFIPNNEPYIGINASNNNCV